MVSIGNVGRDMHVRDIIEASGGSSVDTSGSKDNDARILANDIHRILAKEGHADLGEMLKSTVDRVVKAKDRNPYVEGLEGIVKMIKAAKEDLAPTMDKLLGLIT